MDISPPWEPVSGWPCADDDHQPDESADLLLTDYYPFKDRTDASEQAHTIDLSTTMSLLDSCIAPLSGCSDDVNYFNLNAVNQNQYSAVEALNDNTWPPNERFLVSVQRGYSRGDNNQLQKSSIDRTLHSNENQNSDYSIWQPGATGYGLDAYDSIPYGSILEELNQMDTSTLANGMASFDDPLHSDTYAACHSGDTKWQSLHATSQTVAGKKTSEEVMLPLSPVSNDETIVKKEMTPQEAPSRAKMPHSAVEKRYRSNLNSKLLNLQQCVPALHAKTDKEEDVRSPDGTMGDPSKAVKLQKGLILSGAVEYILELSTRTSQLEAHRELLERRLAILQKIALQKNKGVVSISKTADHKRHRAPAVTKPMSPASPTTEVFTGTISAEKSLSKTTDQTGVEKGSEKASNEYGREAPNDLAIHSGPSSEKRRKISRSQIAEDALCSLTGLALWDGYNDS